VTLQARIKQAYQPEHPRQDNPGAKMRRKPLPKADENVFPILVSSRSYFPYYTIITQYVILNNTKMVFLNRK